METMPKKMTDKQALAEARKRWGKDAIARKASIPTVGILKERNISLKLWERYAGKTCYTVSRPLGFTFQVMGRGLSWEEAFEMADKSN